MLDPLVPAVKNGNLFMVLRGEVEGRLDVPFYAPEIMELERKLRLKSNKKLSHFIKKMASGSTPSIQEEEKYYSDKENGIPFIRVQNLNPNNILSLDDLKYINHETHNNYLKRSQVAENDLLVKITGVGRMAVASIAPKGFVGNTNQHLVVIKTKDLETSEILATFLNTDIGEKLATRRSAGGTRPALDYAALRSIPIVFLPEMVKIIKDAVENQRQKEAQAKAMLASIDGYLLAELGISLPEASEKQKVFKVCSKEVSGGRFDPKLYLPSSTALLDCLLSSSYPTKRLKTLMIHSSAGDWGIESEEENYQKCLVIRATEFDNRFNLKLDNNRVKYRYISDGKFQKIDVQEKDILIEKSGGSEDQPVGRVALISKDILENNTIAFSNFIHKIRLSNEIDSNYAYYFLKFIHNIKVTDLMQSQTNGIRNLIMKEYFNIPIVLPPLSQQAEIAQHINALREAAAALESEAAAGLSAAKAAVEKMILGE